MPIAEAHRIYPSKTAMLMGLTRAIDEKILQSLDGDPLEGSAKDRLFDIVMRRFDVLKADRNAYRRLMRQLPATPDSFAALLCQMRRSLSLTLEAAGISTSGLKGALRLKACSQSTSRDCASSPMTRRGSREDHGRDRQAARPGGAALGNAKPAEVRRRPNRRRSARLPAPRSASTRCAGGAISVTTTCDLLAARRSGPWRGDRISMNRPEPPPAARAR